jgi:hypothetical protein
MAIPTEERPDVGQMLAIGRIGLGAALMFFPTLASAGYMGKAASHPSVRVLNRLFGARDVALGAWYLLAQGNREQERQALTAGVACDAWDALTAARAGEGLPRWGRPMVVATALGAAAAGASALRAR